MAARKVYLLCMVLKSKQEKEGILKTLYNAQPGDFDDIYQRLDNASNMLEYRKYGETLFKILLTSGVLGS
ncbi:18859_t:CDS:2 [Racocetra fulgida]|uniref:18859_t:CDS:1 n=1 Tax=Racocetra fulgida TaxID=60492 RepID=A0A9N8ZEP9_9GLOM|nr:18859_t:CDS:2 [Racocetra fulgida]